MFVIGSLLLLTVTCMIKCEALRLVIDCCQPFLLLLNQYDIPGIARDALREAVAIFQLQGTVQLLDVVSDEDIMFVIPVWYVRSGCIGVGKEVAQKANYMSNRRRKTLKVNMLLVILNIIYKMILMVNITQFILSSNYSKV